MSARPAPHTAATADSDEAWMLRLDEIGEELGYFQPLGGRHAAFFVDDGPTLLVTFESVAAIRGGSDSQMPLGYRIAQRAGWSHLCLIADGETWYRDPAVHAYFDRLVDDAFFEDFDRVVFYGAGAGGYGAAAYSVTAPGSTVIAVRPQATLDPRLAEWDRRYLGLRRLDFTDRYGFAPDMVEGAQDVFVFYDPEQRDDAMHAALFNRAHVSRIRCRFFGPRLEEDLQATGVLRDAIESACLGHLDAADIHEGLRARRDHPAYVLRLLARLEVEARWGLVLRLCRWAEDAFGLPRFAHARARAEAELAARPTPHAATGDAGIEAGTEEAPA